MIDRNADVPEDKRIMFRIGINLGDVIVDGADIFGDGVNIAARLEALGGAGRHLHLAAWCETRSATASLSNSGTVGEQSVNNIARPVRVYAMARARGAIAAIAATAPWAAGKRRDAVLPDRRLCCNLIASPS